MSVLHYFSRKRGMNSVRGTRILRLMTPMNLFPCSNMSLMASIQTPPITPLPVLRKDGMVPVMEDIPIQNRTVMSGIACLVTNRSLNRRIRTNLALTSRRYILQHFTLATAKH